MTGARGGHGRAGVSSEAGFSIAELAVVVAIIGFLAIVAPLELRPTNNITALNSGVTQVGRALKEAYSIAQQEKVNVTINFYSSSNEDAAKRNSYEVLRGAEPMMPPIGIRYSKVGVSGVNHYYGKLLEGGGQPYFPSDATIYFKPVGAVTMCVDASGNPAVGTVGLTYDGVGSKTVTVNQQGGVSP